MLRLNKLHFSIDEKILKNIADLKKMRLNINCLSSGRALYNHQICFN